MNNKKRFKSSDLSINAFIICAGVGVLVGALFLCFLFLSFSHISFIAKHISIKQINAMYILSFILCGYVSALLYKKNSVLISLFSSFVYCILINMNNIKVNFIMLSISCVLGSLLYEMCKKDINENKA